MRRRGCPPDCRPLCLTRKYFAKFLTSYNQKCGVGSESPSSSKESFEWEKGGKEYKTGFRNNLTDVFFKC